MFTRYPSHLGRCLMIICKHQRSRSGCTSMQSDLDLCCLHGRHLVENIGLICLGFQCFCMCCRPALHDVLHDEAYSRIDKFIVNVYVFHMTHPGCSFLSEITAIPAGKIPSSILRKSTSVRHRPVSYPDGPMTARYRFT